MPTILRVVPILVLAVLIFLTSVWPRTVSADTNLPNFNRGESQIHITLPWVYPFTGTPDRGAWVFSSDGCQFGGLNCAEEGHHTGEDWVLNANTRVRGSVESANQNVYAVNNGVVVWTGVHGRSGYLVIIRHDTPPNTTITRPSFHFNVPATTSDIDVAEAQIPSVYSYYLHLGEIDKSVLQNPDRIEYDGSLPAVYVRKGQIIGTLFKEARPAEWAYPAHLHFEMWTRPRVSGGVVYDSNGYDPTDGNRNFRDSSQVLIRGSEFLSSNNTGLYVTQIDEPTSGKLVFTGLGFTNVNRARLEVEAGTPYARPLQPLVLLEPALPPPRSDTLMEASIRFLWRERNPKTVFRILKSKRSAALSLSNTRNGQQFRYPHYYPFSDVAPSRSDTEQIITLWKKGIMGGYTQYNSFAPLNRINRAEFIATVVKGARIPLPAGDDAAACTALRTTFSDIPRDSNPWYCRPLLAAYRHENPNNEDLNARRVFSGSQGQLKSEAFLTRAEAVAMIANAFDFPVAASVSQQIFSDVPTDQWFARYVETAREEGIAAGYRDLNGQPIGRFGPGDVVSRGMAAMFVNNAMDQ